ncbi:MAG: VanZ family protein [Hungatella sp.]|nr:VanZ family protein [Hungatella sp.]
MIKNTTRNQKFGWVLFVMYLIALTYFMFFAEAMGRTGNTQAGYAYNLELFKEIRRFYVYRHQLGWKAVTLNLGGNVVGFMPFGFFLPIVSRRGRKWYNALLLGFFLSLCIEITQLVFKVGSFDVDDLLLNTIGGILGFCCYKIVQKVRIRRKLRARKESETAYLGE